jgi:hypothetical protein
MGEKVRETREEGGGRGSSGSKKRRRKFVVKKSLVHSFFLLLSHPSTTTASLSHSVYSHPHPRGSESGCFFFVRSSRLFDVAVALW